MAEGDFSPRYRKDSVRLAGGKRWQLADGHDIFRKHNGQNIVRFGFEKDASRETVPIEGRGFDLDGGTFAGDDEECFHGEKYKGIAAERAREMSDCSCHEPRDFADAGSASGIGAVLGPDVRGDGGCRCRCGGFSGGKDIHLVLEWAEGAGGDGDGIAGAEGDKPDTRRLYGKILVDLHAAMQAAMGCRVKSAKAALRDNLACRTLLLGFEGGGSLLITAPEPGMVWVWEPGSEGR